MLLCERERERTVDLEDGASPKQAQAQAARRLYTPGLQRKSTPASATLDQEDGSPSQAQQPSSMARRLYTPGIQRDTSASASASAKPDLVTIESQRSLHIEDDYEPSPTPTPRPRQSQSIDESSIRNNNKLPQLTIAPPPLPTLPSETTARQQDKLTTARKVATASTTTRTNPGMTITTPCAAPTTAITHTTRRDPHARQLLPVKSFTLKRTRVLTRAACHWEPLHRTLVKWLLPIRAWMSSPFLPFRLTVRDQSAVLQYLGARRRNLAAWTSTWT